MTERRTRTITRQLGPLLVVVALATACSATASGDSGTPAETAAPGAETTTTTSPSAPASAPTSTTVEATSTSSTVAPSSTATVETTTTTEPLLQPSANGPRVEALQRRLAELGYSIGPADGRYGGSTSSAVMAFQKVEGLSADGVAGPATLARLDDPRGAVPSGGEHRVEIDLARQVLFVVNDAGTRIFNTSTGNGEEFLWPDGTPGLAYTPTGSFAVYYQVDGVDDGALGAMYRPKYFHTDWAIHGSSYVPAYPASHGCARVSNFDQDWIWDNVPMGTTVVVY